MKSYWTSVLEGRINRRRVLTASGAAGAAAILAACGSSSKSSSGGSGAASSSSSSGGSSSAASSSAGKTKDTSGLVSQVVDDEKNAVRGGTLKLFHFADQQTLDPMFTSLPNQFPVNSIYGQFWTYTGGHLKPFAGEIKGDVAQGWELSPDKLQYTIKLSDKAAFSPIPPTNGRAMDAQDVVYSWERFKAQGTRRSDFANELNPQAPILSMTATDSKTVVIKLAAPYARFEYLMTNGQAGYMFVVPKEAEDQKALDLRRQSNGTGPWYLADYQTSASMTMKRNPGFKQDDRGWPYMDQIDAPIITEYAQQLAQFKAGQIYTFSGLSSNIRNEDILPTKKEVPKLELITTPVTPAFTRNFFGMLPESPFKDERVRQAWTSSIDRDAFIDVIFNVSKYQKEGITLDTAWDSALAANAWDGWWVDPKGADWAQFYKYDIANAKKLLAAAGFANGVDANVRYPATGYPDQYFQSIQIYLGMVQDAGFRPKQLTVRFDSEWRPQLADARGQFEGVSFIVDSGSSDPGQNLFQHYNIGGSLNHGYDADGQNARKGDPTLNDLTAKAAQEFDEAKRKDLVKQIQMYEAKKIYFPKVAGGAQGFAIYWPAFRGTNVWQSPLNRNFAWNWLDKTKAPFV